ncbi:MAG TPA: T9SS type A sorting domain-containing protein [candidate division WOR-3 bacterium]|uniref:T9SS type A sorting domain-containing protein n=1 Tax=candidate division WOR-3 bacterium TaxID=2052148 RepID=A0A9C9JZ81_UNCW3|nr:T9SS type A sorting domain-containing protein [candidate division WOR-3 bacterium]
MIFLSLAWIQQETNAGFIRMIGQAGGDGAYTLVYGADHNLYAGGYSYHFVVVHVFTVISIDTAGSERWLFRTQGTGVCNESAYSLAYGPDNHIYSAGVSYLLDFTVISLDTTGSRQWEFLYGQPGDDRAYDNFFGLDGNIYAAGYISVSGAGFEFAVISLTDMGDTNWIYSINGSANGNDVAQAIVYGADEHIYCAGWIIDTSSAEDFVVIRLNTTGAEEWKYKYNGADNNTDKAAAVVYGQDDNIYAAGCCTDSGNLDFVVISLDTTTTGVDEKQIQTSDIQCVHPFSTFFTNSIVLEVNNPPCNLEIVLYDVQGRKKYETLLSSPPTVLEINDGEISLLPKGIYFLRININSVDQEVVKLIKI